MKYIGILILLVLLTSCGANKVESLDTKYTLTTSKEIPKGSEKSGSSGY